MEKQTADLTPCEVQSQFPTFWDAFIAQQREVCEIDNDCVDDEDQDDLDTIFTGTPDEIVENLASTDYPTKLMFRHEWDDDHDYITVWCDSDNGRFQDYVAALDVNTGVTYDLCDTDGNEEVIDWLYKD